MKNKILHLLITGLGLLCLCNPANAQTIAGGHSHSLFICNNGTVKAWGKNQFGQLGIGTNTDSNIPVTVNSLTGIVAVSGGENQSIALKNDGTVWTWGQGTLGQLGHGTWADSNVRFRSVLFRV
jgi:alpha-tubulin suppressor-like RCC1 family protein